jgi:hypothetical protein
MIDPSFDGEIATITSYPLAIQELEQKVAKISNDLTNMENDRNFWHEKAHKRILMINNLEQYVKEQYDYIDEDVTQSLVDIFDLKITKEYDVQVTVTFTGTVAAPLNFDMEELENALEATLDSSYYGNDIVVDFSEDNMDINWSEL